MSARKQINTQKNADRTTLMSDYGKLPGHNVDEYADRLTAARRKFDRLCEFSLDEHEASFERVTNRLIGTWKGRKEGRRWIDG